MISIILYVNRMNLQIDLLLSEKAFVLGERDVKFTLDGDNSLTLRMVLGF